MRAATERGDKRRLNLRGGFCRVLCGVCGGGGLENCRNARGCFFVHFKAKRRFFAVSFIDLRKFMF